MSSSYYLQNEFTLTDIEQMQKENNTPRTWSPKDWWGGFKEENLPVMAFEAMKDNEDFPSQDGYNYAEDKQLKGYEDFFDHFYFSRSEAESRAILDKLKERAETNYASPWYHLGRVTGAFTDPSTLLLFTKAPVSVKLFGSALLAEEFTKQNLDKVRDDSYVPWVAGAGFGIPIIANMFKKAPNIKTQEKIAKLDKHWNEGTPPKTNEIYTDGRFVDGDTKLVPGSVGAAATGEGKKIQTLAKAEAARLEGEQFMKTYLYKFGEDGPWTPVFRLTKSKSIAAREMIENLLDTPLLKLKNLPKGKFEATAPGGSLETQLRMYQQWEIENMRFVKEQYLKYLKRTNQIGQDKNMSDLGILTKNTISPTGYSINGFSKEIAKARIKGNHDIPEVAASSRYIYDNLYKKLFDQANELKIRQQPVEHELNFWKGQLERFKEQKMGKSDYYEPSSGTYYTMTKTEMENIIKNLEETLENINKNKGVDNYLNRIYNRPAIESNPAAFRKIIYENYQRAFNAGKIKQMPSKTVIDDLIDDLSNSHPFLNPERHKWKDILNIEIKTALSKAAMNISGQKPGSKLYQKTLDDLAAQLEKVAKSKKKPKGDFDDLMDLLKKQKQFKTFEELLKEIDTQFLISKYVFNRPRYARALKRRTLNLDQKAQLELLEQGFILNDIFALQKVYYRSMTPDILLTRRYGDTQGLGINYKGEAHSMTFPGVLQVAKDYNAKIFQANNKAERKALVKERNQALSDLEASVELLKGTWGLPKDPHAWWSRAMRMAKHYNALTMLTGFMAALPDTARVIMTSGIKRGFNTQFEMFSKGFGKNSLFAMGKKEAQSFAEAIDMINGQRAMLYSDIGDMFGMATKLEANIGRMSQLNFMYINLMSRWTEFAKSAASVTVGSRILEDSFKWTKGKPLADKWKTSLAAAGIDKQMAKRIIVQFEKHGSMPGGKNDIGLKHNWMANTAVWEDKIAKRAFGAALNKEINRTIVTPGLGDTPLFMSKEWGSTWMQFKKFAMAAQQRMLMRGMQEKDLDFLFGSFLLMGTGMMIDAIYHKYRFGRDYNKLSLTQKILNAFDRSGLGGIFMDVNKAIETLTDNRIGIAPLLGAKRPYSPSGRWIAGTVGGPTSGQIYNIFDIIYDVGGKKYNHHTAKNVRRLIPWQNVWYLDWLFDDIEKGLRFK